MKILRITLNNIASLSGTHTVDFTREPLRSAGLFSISGPTGSGKSTLLDALCLSLYDATPRLEPFRRSQDLADFDTKDKQADPRSLLRRGTGEGFTEVAFIGVDSLAWTARWTVRRGHKKADGVMQSVEMALYRGHIAPGATGTVEAGGNKTTVLSAIRDKIGLSFQQFTRAVLLAQNDFATFLKADDKDRAEILQALTGTEHFEAISRATHQRASSEKQLVEQLRSRMEGNSPLSLEARSEAEAATAEAAENVRLVEQQIKVLDTQVAWFKEHSTICDGLAKAQEALALAVSNREAASSRRQQLTLTETVSRDARSLRNAELQAAADITTTAKAHELASAKHQSCVATLAEVDGLQKQAEAAHQKITTEQSDSRALLNQARALDATLAPLQLRFVAASAAMDDAKSTLSSASTKLQTTIHSRETSRKEQDTLQSDRERLANYLPFVSEASLWLDRIDSAIAAQKQVSADVDGLNEATSQFGEKEAEIKLQKESESALQAAFKSAEQSLSDATEAASRFDAEKLAADRARLDAALKLVTRFEVQLKERQTQQDQAAAIVSELEAQAANLAADETSLRHSREVALPAAANAYEAAKSQLDSIKAAIDDHAKRLRATLKADEKCPVCGSVEHPYRQHAPDIAETAVRAAEKSVSDYESNRNEIKDQIARLEAAVNARAESMARRKDESESLRAGIAQWKWEANDHSEVVTILQLASENRLPAAQERIRDLTIELKTIAQSEKDHRAAMKKTEACQKKLDQSRDQLQAHQQLLAELEKQQGVTTEKLINAKRQLETSQQRCNETIDQLSMLWDGLPNSRTEFEREPSDFRAAFQMATSECDRIESRLAELLTEIQKADAAIEPLNEAQKLAQQTLDRCESELKTIISEREAQLAQRLQLFEGKAVDLVEADLQERLQSATKALESVTLQKGAADKSLAAAFSELESALKMCSQAEARLVTARDSMASWLTEFSGQTSYPLTLIELDEMLTRNDDWFKAERTALDQLEAAVTSANSAVGVHAAQLDKHVATRPTEDPESAVLELLRSLQADFADAKERADAARAVLLSDDERRRNNSLLNEQIQQQQELAEPWLKLNELIGSSDGAKFKMIAQRRTLDVLLGYANLQLSQLATRYRLERLTASLNLVVIDREMGDEKRSIHSLSGGESFLVSLALALGLASLTSNRLRIESLFIDEGFGSLDAETLNTAMSALMHLESQGRKVGVISHVTEMTDAIPVQIKVVRSRGGASRIVVPGATFEADDDSTVATVERSAKPHGVGPSAEAIATRILEILERERSRGKDKVAAKSLRDEIGCDPKPMKAAQQLLGAKVITDGRSLRLPSDGA